MPCAVAHATAIGLLGAILHGHRARRSPQLDIEYQKWYRTTMDLRQIIRDEMDRQDLTQAAMQKRAGVWQHRISEYLAGKRDVNAETLRRLLEALDLEVRPARRRR